MCRALRHVKDISAYRQLGVRATVLEATVGAQTRCVGAARMSGPLGKVGESRHVDE